MIRPVRAVLQGCWIAILSGLLPGCSTPEGEGIARAGNDYLSSSEAAQQVPPGLSIPDSMAFMKQLALDWMESAVFFERAFEDYEGDHAAIDKQVEEYRRSLYNYAYESKLAERGNDTLVTEKEIEDYYKGHKHEFKLKDNIVKVLFVKLESRAPKIDQVRQWLRSGNPRDRDLLEDYCGKFAGNYYLDDKNWLLFEDLLKEVPIETYDQEVFLRNNRNLEVRDGDYLYLVNIKDFMVRESLSPLSFEKGNIRNLILTRRKMDRVKSQRRMLLKKAMNEGRAELLINEKKK